MNKLAILICHDCKKQKVSGNSMFIPDTGNLDILGNLDTMQQIIKFMSKHEGHMLIWSESSIG